MPLPDKVAIGLAAENKVTVTPEMTVGHVLPGMPAVYGTPTMILHMKIAATLAIRAHLPAGHVSVGTMVNVRHLAAARRLVAPAAPSRASRG